MGHFNFPIFPVWDSLASETSSEELNCCIFGEFWVKLLRSWIKVGGLSILNWTFQREKLTVKGTNRKRPLLAKEFSPQRWSMMGQNLAVKWPIYRLYQIVVSWDMEYLAWNMPAPPSYISRENQIFGQYGPEAILGPFSRSLADHF